MYKIIVWYNPNKNTYYYKKTKETYSNYYVGFKNQYEHEVVVIINDYENKRYKISLKNKVLKRLISFLQKLNK